jgi:hypothetical protein
MRTRRPRDYRTCRAHQVALPLPVCVGLSFRRWHARVSCRNMEDMMSSETQVRLHDELESLAARHLRHTYIPTSEPTYCKALLLIFLNAGNAGNQLRQQRFNDTPHLPSSSSSNSHSTSPPPQLPTKKPSLSLGTHAAAKREPNQGSWRLSNFSFRPHRSSAQPVSRHPPHLHSPLTLVTRAPLAASRALSDGCW